MRGMFEQKPIVYVLALCLLGVVALRSISLAHALDCNEVLIKERPFIRHMAGLFYSQARLQFARRGVTQDDLESEFLVAAWKSLQSFNETKGRLESFLTTTFRWRVRDLIRSDKDFFNHKRSLDELREDDLFEAEDTREAYQLVQVTSVDEWQQVLRVANRVLSKTKLNIFGLYWFGLTKQQIADVTGMRMRSVRGSLRHSFVELRRVMSNERQ